MLDNLALTRYKHSGPTRCWKHPPGLTITRKDRAMTMDTNTTSPEIWKPVVGYEDFYEVSSLGRVKSLRQNKVMSPSLSCGRPGVMLIAPDKRRRYLVARLVCRAFHGEPFPGAQAAHNDGSRDNNCADNLRWATVAENMADKRLHGTHLELDRHPNRKIDAATAREVKRLLADGMSQHKIAGHLGIKRHIVCSIAMGLAWVKA